MTDLPTAEPAPPAPLSAPMFVVAFYDLAGVLLKVTTGPADTVALNVSHAPSGTARIRDLTGTPWAGLAFHALADAGEPDAPIRGA